MRNQPVTLLVGGATAALAAMATVLAVIIAPACVAAGLFPTIFAAIVSGVWIFGTLLLGHGTYATVRRNGGLHYVILVVLICSLVLAAAFVGVLTEVSASPGCPSGTEAFSAPLELPVQTAFLFLVLALWGGVLADNVTRFQRYFGSPRRDRIKRRR